MERIWFMFWVIPALTIAITVSSNGNSPETKMIGGMMVDTEKGFVPMTKQPENTITEKSNYEKSRTLKLNNTKLSINERYRRLIPYMTFYYANDMSTPTTETYSTKDVQVEKLHLVEAPLPERTARILQQQSYHNVPRYHGNRLTKYNIASSNPGRLFKDTTHYNLQKTPNYNIESKYLTSYNNDRYVQKNKPKPEITYPTYQTRKPFSNLYQSDENSNLRYYLVDKDPVQKYKLIPYEQTPPVKIVQESGLRYENYQKPSFVKESVYIKPRPQLNYDNIYYKSLRKQPVTVSENYYEKVPPSGHSLKIQPFIETGFKPIISDHVRQTTDYPVYMSTVTESPLMYYEGEKQVSLAETASIAPDTTNTILRPTYYQYVVDQPVRQQVQPEYVSNAVSLGDLFNSLQDTKSIPKPLTRDNVGASIKTLLQVLNALRVAGPLENEVMDAPVLSTPKPFVVTPKLLEITSKPVAEPVIDDVELSQEPYLAPVTPPSQHLDDFHVGGGSTQTFPLRGNSDDEGGTPGKPGVDYPILTVIPETSFDCKTQRYKGFFADPETKCQVWHYCDLNGGQASFLCPNGTIFSQAGLTCDWWFNVRCASTTQLYVLNESLYKYILPHSPKFPEDYSGPLVDKYLTLKFKEMEEQFRKNKNKQTAENKMDSNEDKEESEEINTDPSDSAELGSSEKAYVSEPNIVVETQGTSGNVAREA